LRPPKLTDKQKERLRILEPKLKIAISDRDFETAKKLWEDPNRIEIPARWLDEPRHLLIAFLNEGLWSAIYTVRNKKIRIISVRKSRNDEKEIYDSLGI